jgi:hypothetical protein
LQELNNIRLRDTFTNNGLKIFCPRFELKADKRAVIFKRRILIYEKTILKTKIMRMRTTTIMMIKKKGEKKKTINNL